jgi:hypothetical protein
VNRSQWILVTTFAASFYGIGNIWMTQFGWRLWPYVAPDDFIDLCIKNAIIDIEVQNSYAQTKRECRSSGRPAQTSFGVAG